MADLVEQALEWAQRISNGESWIELCDLSDDSNCYRLIDGMNHIMRKVGRSNSSYETSTVAVKYGKERYFMADRFSDTVPLVVCYI